VTPDRPDDEIRFKARSRWQLESDRPARDHRL